MRSSRLVWAVVAVSAVVAAAISARALQSWRSRTELGRAALLLGRGNLEACRLALDGAAAMAADTVGVTLLEARLARAEGDYGRMRVWLDRARRAGVGSSRVFLEEALAAADVGRLTEVERYLLERLGTHEDDRAEICDALSTGMARHGRLDEAGVLLDAWRRDAPTDPRPILKQGRFAEHGLDWAAAESHYREALGVAPGNVVALQSLGRVLAGRREPVEARRCFEQVAANSPVAVPAANESIAGCLIEEGRADEARSMLEQLVELDEPSKVRAYERVGYRPEGDVTAILLGKIALDAGHADEAERWLSRAVEANPRDIEARYSLAQALRLLGRDAEATVELKAVAEARKNLAAIDHWWDRLGTNPDDVEARYEIGLAFLRFRSESEGLYWLRSVIARDPDHAAAHAALANHFASSEGESESRRSLAEYHRQRAERASRNTDRRVDQRGDTGALDSAR